MRANIATQPDSPSRAVSQGGVMATISGNPNLVAENESLSISLVRFNGLRVGELDM